MWSTTLAREMMRTGRMGEGAITGVALRLSSSSLNVKLTCSCTLISETTELMSMKLCECVLADFNMAGRIVLDPINGASVTVFRIAALGNELESQVG